MAENGSPERGDGRSEGPAKGGPWDNPYTTRTPIPAPRPQDQPIPSGDIRRVIERTVGAGDPVRNDPAFQLPHDALNDPGTRERATRVYRDVPIVTIQNAWTVPDVRRALWSHMSGMFELSGQLMDSMLGDDRVQATLGSRLSGLFGREVRSEPANDSRAAREVQDAWMSHFPVMLSSGAIPESQVHTIFMGVGNGQILWDISDPKIPFKPYPRPWHPRYEYFDWITRKYIAISQDGNLPVLPGDGKWYQNAPFGSYRGFVRGAVRAVAEPWLIRHFAIRDWARFSEVHGLPTRIGYSPSTADPGERSQFEQRIACLGSEPTLLIARGVDKESKDTGYGYELVEAESTSWEAFPGLRDQCDMAIVLAIMFQNLTTEVSGGAFASTKSHMDIRQQGLQHDNAGWKATLHRDFARPFAFLNYGDASLAPWTYFDVTSREDYANNAKQWQAFGTGLEVLRRGGIKFKDQAAVRDFAKKRFNLSEMPEFDITDPVGHLPGEQPGSTPTKDEED